MGCLRVFLIVALCVAAWPAPSAHAAVTDLGSRSDPIYVSRTAQMLIDPTHSLSIDQVARSPDFVPFSRLPDTRAAYWLKLSYVAPQGAESWYLFLGYKVDTADLYLPSGGGYTVTRSGVALAQVDRPVNLLGSIAFALPPTPTPLTIYVRITAADPTPSIAYSPSSALWTINQFNLLMIVGLDSILLAMLVSSLVLFAMARSRIYAIYAAYLLAELLARSNETGLASAVFWPNWAISIVRLDMIFDALRIVMATAVVRSFLRLREHSPLLDRINLSISIAAGAYALAIVLGATVHLSWAREFAFVYVPLWIVSAIVAWRHGEERAPLFVIAWSALLLFSMGFALQLLFGLGRGNLIAELFVTRGVYFGVGIQSVLLSLAFSTDLKRLAAARDRAERLAGVDSLTGIPNRRSFDTVVRAEWDRAASGQHPVSLLMIDVDHFKAYNDALGHVAGDTCLRAVAQAASASLPRGGGEIFRYGGEEFAVILPNIDAGTAQSLAERIRGSIAARALPHPSAPTGVITVSIGAATARPGTRQRVEDWQNEADQALYRAKQAGRNRVAAAS